MTVYELKINGLNYRMIPIYDMGLQNFASPEIFIRDNSFFGYTVFISVKDGSDVCLTGRYFDGEVVLKAPCLDLAFGGAAFWREVRGAPFSPLTIEFENGEKYECQIVEDTGRVGIIWSKCKQLCTNNIILSDGVEVRTALFDVGERVRLVECHYPEVFSGEILCSLLNRTGIEGARCCAAYSYGKEAVFLSTSSYLFDFSASAAIAYALRRRGQLCDGIKIRSGARWVYASLTENNEIMFSCTAEYSHRAVLPP